MPRRGAAQWHFHAHIVSGGKNKPAVLAAVDALKPLFSKPVKSAATAIRKRASGAAGGGDSGDFTHIICLVEARRGPHPYKIYETPTMYFG